MLSKARTILLLISLTSFIYVLRDSHTSPGSFLKHQASRVLAEKRLTEILCDNEDQEANDISQGERDRADGFRNSLSKIRDGNPLVQFIEGPEPRDEFADEYVVPIVKYAAPWIVLFAVSIVVCISFSINWCCMNLSCNKKAKCCGPSQSSKCKGIFMISGIAFMVCIIGAGIAGVVFSSRLIKGGNKTVCSAGILLDKLIDGSMSEKWLGLDPAVEAFQAVLEDYNNMTFKLITAITTTSMTAFKIAAGTDVNYAAANTAASTWYTVNRFSSVSPRPDPAQTTNPLFPASYTPTYIKALENNTDLIKEEMSVKKTTVDQSCLNTDIAVLAIKASDLLFFYQLQQAQEITKNATIQLDTVEDSVGDFGSTGKDVFRGLGGALIAIFSTELIMGGVAIVSIFFVCFKATMCFSKCLNLSWCTLGFLTILGWVLSAIMFPLSLALFEGCEVGNKVVQEPGFFNQTFGKFLNQSDEDMRTAQGILYRCLHGNGDLIEELNLTEIVGVFEGLFDALDDMAVYTESIQPVVNSVIIPEQRQIISDYKTGLVVDAEEIATDLAKLNSLTNSKSNQCTQVQDTWTLNSETCTSSDGTVFQSASAANFNLKNPTCIGYNNWVSQDIEQRYTTDAFPLSCGQQNNNNENVYLQNFVDNFVENRQDVGTVFDTINSSLSTVNSANTVFMGSVKLVANNFIFVREATNIAYQALGNETTGFFPNSNCKFIRQGTINLLDSMCVRFLSSFFQTTVVIIIISFLSLFGIFMLFFLTKRLAGADAKGKYGLTNVNSQA